MTRLQDLSIEELLDHQEANQRQATTTNDHDARMGRVVEALNCTLDELIERARRSAQPTVSRAAAPRHNLYHQSHAQAHFRRIVVKPFPTDITVDQARDFFQMIAGPVKEVFLGINMAEVVFKRGDGYRAYMNLNGTHWKDNGKTIRVIPVYGPRSTEDAAIATGAALLSTEEQRRARRAQAATQVVTNKV